MEEDCISPRSTSLYLASAHIAEVNFSLEEDLTKPSLSPVLPQSVWESPGGKMGRSSRLDSQEVAMAGMMQGGGLESGAE